jgi:phage terminase small subunit
MMALKMSFTAKKRAYVKARLAGKNIQDSAIEAGYSVSAARQSGSRLEKDPDVQAAMTRLKAGGKIDTPKDPPAKTIVNKPDAKTKKPALKPAGKAPKELKKDAAKMPDWVSMLAAPPGKKTEKKAVDIDPGEARGVDEIDDPIEFMRQMMKDRSEDPRLRFAAAKALAEFTVSKPGAKGKKEEQADAAKEVAKKFSSIAPPKMTLVKK